jgi:hypothetical protein
MLFCLHTLHRYISVYVPRDLLTMCLTFWHDSVQFSIGFTHFCPPDDAANILAYTSSNHSSVADRCLNLKGQGSNPARVVSGAVVIQSHETAQRFGVCACNEWKNVENYLKKVKKTSGPDIVKECRLMTARSSGNEGAVATSEFFSRVFWSHVSNYICVFKKSFLPVLLLFVSDTISYTYIHA